MAVVNVNRDSFSDPRGGVDAEERAVAARAAVAAGAHLVDLGAQSAALAAEVVTDEGQVALLEPLVAELTDDGVVVSVDTYRPAVARAVLAAGAVVLNDYSGQPAREVVEAVAASDGWYVLTHNPVGPRQRQEDADFYDDVVDDTVATLTADLELVTGWGLPAERVVLDPGVDVGKTPAQSLALLRGRARVRAAFDNPLLWAIGRKDVLGALTGRPPSQRDAGTLALLAAVAELPGCIVRLHDVAGAVDHLRVHAALRGEVDLDADVLLDDRLRREG